MKTEEYIISYRPDQTPIKIFRIVTGSDRPWVSIVSNVHGDEITTLPTLWRLKEYIENNINKLNGRVDIIPAVNVEGIIYKKRIEPYSSRDLNRSYPGDENGSLADKIAYRIFSLTKNSDLVIDLHTAGYSIPHIIIDRISGLAADKSYKYGHESGLTVLYDFPTEKYIQMGLDKSLTAVLLKEGVPSFTLELPGSSYIDYDGLKSLKNILVGIGIITGEKYKIDILLLAIIN